jgi:murein DD-endopeptidase MepM/ murein hydrolase activator NlpD
MINRHVILWRRRQDGGADNAPELNANQAFGDAPHLRFDSDPRLTSHPRFARRAVDIKWLAALLLMASAASLMLGTVWTSLGSGLSAAVAPVPFLRAEIGGDLQRADRLTPVQRPRERNVIRTRIEQLAEDGHSTKPFTYVMAHLARTSRDLHTPKIPVDNGVDETVVSAAAPAVPAAFAPVAFATGDALPPEIRFGASRPAAAALPAHASAYADPDVLPPTPLLGVPINLSVIAKAAGAVAAERRVIVARGGDTLDNILTALGVTVQDAGAIATLLTPHSWFGRDSFAGGEIVTVLQDRAQGQARPWQVSLARDGKAERVAVLSDDGGYLPAAPRPHAAAVAADAEQDDVALRPSLDPSKSSMKLAESLTRLVQDESIAPSLIGDIRRLCAQDVDLETAISASDTAELLYSQSVQGKPELAFAALTLDGRTHRYYRFTAPDDGTTDYYDADGHSVTASLMNKPVADGRLGDGFGWRIHPILRDRRFHEGVDYAAPFGSPIAAAGAGVVEKIDQQWGYGKFVRIRHDFGYETTYAHLSGVPRGLRIGERIHPGQTIGFIGSTGLSTGPHLYYELRVNGRYADPLRAHLPAGRVLEGDVLAAFQRARARTDLLLQASARSADSGL